MESFIGMQLIGIIFALFMLYYTHTRLKRNEFTMKEALFWGVAWLGVFITAVLPHAFRFFIKEYLNINRPLDFYIIIGFFFVLGFIFYTYTIIRGIQRKMDELVRKMSIEEIQKKG